MAHAVQSRKSCDDSIVTNILLVLFTVHLYLFLQPLKLASPNLVYNLGLGVAYQEITFRTKTCRVWAREDPKNLGPPYLFLQLLNLVNSNLAQDLGLRSRLPKTTFSTIFRRGLG